MNYIRTQRKETRWPVTTSEAIQIYGADIAISGSPSTDWLTSSHVNSLPGIFSSGPLNNSGSKSSCTYVSTCTNYYPTLGVICFTKWHSCWRELCILAYDTCICRCAIPDSFLVKPSHPSNFSISHSWYACTPTINHMMSWILVYTWSPMSWNNSWSHCILQYETTKIFLVVLGKYLQSGPSFTNHSRW